MKKPYIKIQHLIVEVIGFAFIIASFIYALVKASTIEGEIPTHYNLSGEIDAYGSPYTLLILPIIMFVTMLIVLLVNHLVPPKYWNLPFPVRPETALLVFMDMTMMIAIIEMLTGMFTLFDTLVFLNPNVSGLWAAAIYVASLFIDIIVMCIRAKKHS